MVEYKHWTGNLDAQTRFRRGTSLRAQLMGQISGGKEGFSALIVRWPAFKDLDAESREWFYGILEEVRAYSQGAGSMYRGNCERRIYGDRRLGNDRWDYAHVRVPR